MAHARAVFTDPGIVPLPRHRSTLINLSWYQLNEMERFNWTCFRIDFSDSHSEGGSIAPKEDWTICTRWGFRKSKINVCINRMLIYCVQVWDVQTSSGAPLQNLQTLHQKDGPSLSLDKQLCRREKPEIFHPVFNVRGVNVIILHCIVTFCHFHRTEVIFLQICWDIVCLRDISRNLDLVVDWLPRLP